MKMTRILFAKMIELFSNQNDFDPSVATDPAMYVPTQNFADSPTLTFAELVFGGFLIGLRSNTVMASLGLEVRINPVTGDYEVAMLTLSPWEIVRTFAGSPLTAYGVIVQSQVSGLLLAYQHLPEPITFIGAASAHLVSDLSFRFPTSMVS